MAATIRFMVYVTTLPLAIAALLIGLPVGLWSLLRDPLDGLPLLSLSAATAVGLVGLGRSHRYGFPRRSSWLSHTAAYLLVGVEL